MLFLYNINHFIFYIIDALWDDWGRKPTLAKFSEVPDLRISYFLIFRTSDNPNLRSQEYDKSWISQTSGIHRTSNNPNLRYTSDFPIFRISEFRGVKKINAHEKNKLQVLPVRAKTSHSTCKTSVLRFSEFLIIQIPDFPNVRISANFPISEYPIFRFSDFLYFQYSEFPIFQFCNFPIF